MTCSNLLNIAQDIDLLGGAKHQINSKICSLKNSTEATMKINQELLNQGKTITTIMNKSCSFVRENNFNDCPFFR